MPAIIWILTAANKKQHMDISSSDATTGMQGGRERGRRGVGWEERREERWGVVRDIPSDYCLATWVFPCFNKAEFRHFKELTPPVPRSEPFDPTLMKKAAPAGEEGGRGSRSCCSPLPCRRVRWLPARHSSAATASVPLLTPLNQINSRYLCGQGRLLSYGKNSTFPTARRVQQGLWEMCVPTTGNS